MSKQELEKDNHPAVDTSIGIQPANKKADPSDSEKDTPTSGQTEIGGRKKGLDPTRYGDWEKNGRCIDF